MISDPFSQKQQHIWPWQMEMFYMLTSREGSEIQSQVVTAHSTIVIPGLNSPKVASVINYYYSKVNFKCCWLCYSRKASIDYKSKGLKMRWHSIFQKVLEKNPFIIQEKEMTEIHFQRGFLYFCQLCQLYTTFLSCLHILMYSSVLS